MLIILILFFFWVDQINEPVSNQWQSLFNDKDLIGYISKIHRHEVGDNFVKNFLVVDSAIQVNYDQYDAFEEK